jgi:hypothetical protein
MNVQQEVKAYINSQAEPKRSDMQALHQVLTQGSSGCRLWFSDGKNSDNKTVANPTIGYGFHKIRRANGKITDWFKIGVSANKSGISIYILGIEDKTYLARTYGKELGRASVTGYCIRFKTLKDINMPILEAAIRYGLETQGKEPDSDK